MLVLLEISIRSHQMKHYQLFWNKLSNWRFCLKLILTILVVVFLLYQMWFMLYNWNGFAEPHRGMQDLSPDDMDAYNQGWRKYKYNAWLADRIPMRRNLPKMSDHRCPNVLERKLKIVQAATIVVIFRNEQPSVLLRTLHSLMDRTPEMLIGELMLINDNSDMDMWQDEIFRYAFEEYVVTYITDVVRFFHLEEQVGLVRARRFAAYESGFDILVFLDSHVEVTEGWLVPLIDEVFYDMKTIACAHLDVIDENTLEYVRVAERRSIFDWSLQRREVPLLWEQLMQLPDPFQMPLLHSSVFAVNANLFIYLDDIGVGVTTPAAFELEISLLMWGRGHRIVQVPCSRVGHLQPSDLSHVERYVNISKMAIDHRKSNKLLAELYFDNPKYKSVIFRHQPQIRNIPVGNIAEQQQVLELENLTSIDWYLQHVAPELLQHFPLQARFDLASGSLRSAQLPSNCLTGDPSTLRVSLESCEEIQPSSLNWTLTLMNDIRLSGSSLCFEVQPDRSLALSLCHNLGVHQHWHFNMQHNSLISNRRCLQHNEQNHVSMTNCELMEPRQMWFFEKLNILPLSSANSIN